jgi:Putative Ig domain
MPGMLRGPSLGIALLLAAVLAGCGGSSPISVSVSQPSPQTIDGGGTASISATVTDSKGVNWTVSCSATPSCGQVSPPTSTSGQKVSFIAPNPNPTSAALMVTVTATSVKDITKFSSVQVTVAAPFSVTTSALPDGSVGVAYSQSLQAAGGILPYTWSVPANSVLPAGLALSSSGAVTGTPTAAGNTVVPFQVADSGSPAIVFMGSANVSLNTGPPSVTTTALPNATIDTAYTQTLQASGGIPPYSWTVTSGSLPVWATLDSAGRIRGIPGAAGSANFTVQATDAEFQPLMATQALSITVAAGSSPNLALLKGHYAFLFGGFDDVSGAPFTLAGSFTADGAGNISGGIEDGVGPGNPVVNMPFTGIYNIAADQRGAFTIATASGSKTFACVLGTVVSGVATKGRFVEFDDYSGNSGQRGSGILRLQDSTAFTLASVTGPYAFGFSGVDPAGKREVRVGRFDADGAGTVKNGVEDVNDASTVSNSVSFTGTNTAPSASNGRASLTLNASGSTTTNLTSYVVSAHEILAVSSDAVSSGLAGGVILSQASTSFTNSSFSGNAVFYNAGVQAANPTSQSSSDIGVFTADGAGNVTEIHDQNDGGTLTIDASLSGMSYATSANGRLAFTGGNAFILYLVDINKGFLFDPGGTMGLGFVESQATAPAGGFTNASLSGTFAAGTIAPAVTAVTNESGLATLDGLSKFQTNEDVSTSAALTVNELSSGSYTIGTNGRGLVTSVIISLAGFSPWMVLACLAIWLFFAYRERHFSKSRPRFAAYCMMAWVAVVPEACPHPGPNEIVFYLISPSKAVTIHLGTADKLPPVTIFEQ